MLGDKKVSYSAMQSTGTLTLGNYLGALDNWLKMQEEYECFGHKIFILAKFIF